MRLKTQEWQPCSYPIPPEENLRAEDDLPTVELYE